MITVTAMIGGKSRNGHAESHAITDVVCRQMASRMGFVSRWINSFTTSRFMAQNVIDHGAATIEFPLRFRANSPLPCIGLFCARPAERHSIWRPTFATFIVCRVDVAEKLTGTESHFGTSMPAVAPPHIQLRA
jgi:hypothetical protein